MERTQLFRLCHVCCRLNETEEEAEILKCLHCGKAFLPVNYFEKIRIKAIQASERNVDIPEFIFNPLQGLLVFW